MIALLSSFLRTRSVGVISSLSRQYKIVPEDVPRSSEAPTRQEAKRSEIGDVFPDLPSPLCPRGQCRVTLHCKARSLSLIMLLGNAVGREIVSFRFEADMLTPVQEWLNGQVPFVKSEFRLPWGYCDLVGCAVNRNQARKRLRLGQRQSIGSLERVDILWQIPDEQSGEAITVDQLITLYSPWLDLRRLEAEVRTLEQKRFVLRNSQGGLQKLNGWFPLHTKLIAVELKLTRVEEAVWQAQCHLEFADESYVALPLSVAKRVVRTSRKHELRELGIGLLGANADGVRLLIKSRSHAERDPVLQAHCVERFWQLYLRDS